MINIANAQKIEGWMSDKELTYLAEQAALHDIILEVGSFIGRSTRALGDNTKGIVIAIDLWDDKWFDDDKYKVKEIDPEAFEFSRKHNSHTEFQYNLHDLLASNRVIAHQGYFQGVTYPADMIFIDANHEYECVKEDILHAFEIILPGGLICGHDYNGIWTGVKRAVDELNRPIELHESIWSVNA